MAWLRKDDHYHDHAKVDPLSDAACRLWDICGCWCRKKENLAKPGFVPRSELMFIIKRRWPEDRALELAQELVDANPGGRFTAGLWEICDGGWRFHDWKVYQPIDDEQPLTLSERASKAGKASKLARIAKYGTAQPIRKTKEVSNARTSSTSSANGFVTGIESICSNTQLPLVAQASPELNPELSQKTEQVRALVRDEKTPDSSVVAELNELVHRTQPRTCRTSHLPLRDLKPLSQEPDRDRNAPGSGERELGDSQVSETVTRPKPLSSCERDAKTYEAVDPSVLALFQAWRDEAKKPNAALDWTRREGFEQLVKAGVTVETVQRVVRGAKTDLDWAVGKHRLDPKAILFPVGQREKYLDIETENRKPPRRSGPPVLPPEPPPDPSTLVSLDEMQTGLASLGIATPSTPKKKTKTPEPPKPPDPATIERIDRARAKSKQRLEQFDRKHKSEPPPPIALEA